MSLLERLGRGHLNDQQFARLWTTGGGLTVADAAADPRTLSLLGAIVLPLVPILFAVQAAGWWVFRRRVDRDTPAFF